jgi:hypothetical protein
MSGCVHSVNHIVFLGPNVMPSGEALLLGIVLSFVSPFVDIRTIAFNPMSPYHKAPLTPEAMLTPPVPPDGPLKTVILPNAHAVGTIVCAAVDVADCGSVVLPLWQAGSMDAPSSSASARARVELESSIKTSECTRLKRAERPLRRLK